MGFTRWINFTTISVLLFSIYFSYTVKQIYLIMYPSFNTNGATLDPMWKEGQIVDAEIYLSSRREWKQSDFIDPQVLLIGQFSNLSFNWQPTNTRTIDLTLSRSSTSDVLWNTIRSNATVYLHAHVTKEGYHPNPKHSPYHRFATLHQSHPLTKYGSRVNAKNATFLLAPYFPHWYPKENHSDQYNEPDLDLSRGVGPDPALTASIIKYWKPHMALRLVTDFKQYPIQEIPPLVFQTLRYEQVDATGKYQYLPSFYVEEMGLTQDKLIPLNRTVRSLPLRLSYEPMSYARWQVFLTMDQTFKAQEAMGIPVEEMDSIRSMLADTNPYLLGITLTVSFLHMLFDWLAFKNDISDWKEKDTPQAMIGVSLRSMMITFVSQIVICLYLYEQQTTILVLGPSLLTLVLLLWKIIKVWRVTKLTTQPVINTRMTLTQQADAMATSHLLFILVPIVLGYTAYSLLYLQHVSWYTWLLSSFTGTVYAFGFILMTPQLVINYQLKSVAHLQWRYLMYRFLNTFIDDLFAFIIYMPWMHRLSCLRDDIIFFIYVYQRWIYPIDATREDESSHKKDQ